MNKVLKNIRAKNIGTVIKLFIPFIAVNGVLFLFVYMILDDIKEFQWYYLIPIALALVFSYFVDWTFIKAIVLVINPSKYSLFRKYGPPEKIEAIIDQINKEKICQYKLLVISPKYIYDRSDYSQLVKCDDVLGAHISIHKTNYITDYYEIVLIDKYKDSLHFRFGVKEKEKAEELLILIGSICKNAVIGYTNAEFANVNKKSVALPETAPDDDISNNEIDSEADEENVKESIRTLKATYNNAVDALKNTSAEDIKYLYNTKKIDAKKRDEMLKAVEVLEMIVSETPNTISELEKKLKK